MATAALYLFSSSLAVSLKKAMKSPHHFCGGGFFLGDRDQRIKHYIFEKEFVSS